MTDKAHRETDEKLNAIIRWLMVLYNKKKNEAVTIAWLFFKQFQKADEEMRDKLNGGKITKDEYKKWRKKTIYHSKKFQKLKEELAAYLFILNQTAVDHINGKLDEIYLLNYNAVGVRQNLPNFDKIDRLSKSTQKEMPYKVLKKIKDVRWNRQKIDALVLFGLMRLLPLEEIAQKITVVLDANGNASISYAGVMVTGSENLGRQEAFEKIQDLGYHAEKRWRTVRDDKVRHAHRELDGVQIPLKVPFYNSLGEIRFPGDPLAAAQNIYNCRCYLEIEIL